MKTILPSFLKCVWTGLTCLFLAGCYGDSDDGGDNAETASNGATLSSTKTTSTPDTASNLFASDSAAASSSSSASTASSTSSTTKANPPPKSAAKTFDPGFSASGDVADPSTVNLTGTWKWKFSGVYTLRQSGSSLQGTYTEPSDPSVRGVIAGSIQGARLEMNVMVTYKDKPSANFTAHKSGQIHSSGYITLVVTGGPKFLGNVQEWYKQ